MRVCRGVAARASSDALCRHGAAAAAYTTLMPRHDAARCARCQRHFFRYFRFCAIFATFFFDIADAAIDAFSRHMPPFSSRRFRQQPLHAEAACFR